MTALPPSAADSLVAKSNMDVQTSGVEAMEGSRTATSPAARTEDDARGVSMTGWRCELLETELV